MHGSTTQLLETFIIYIIYLGRVDENLCVKVADFGLAKDIYSSEYYRMSSNTKVPVKWMSPESLLDGFFNEKTDVVCEHTCNGILENHP